MARLQIKGLSLINRHGLVEQRFGDEGLARLQAALRPETARTLSSASAVEWYPAEQLVEIDLAIVACFFEGDLMAGRIIGEQNMNSAISTVYKLLMRLTDPAAVLKRSVSIWEKIVLGATFASTSTGPREAVLEASGFDPIHPIYCQVVAGGIEGVLHGCGEQAGSCEIRSCMLEGAPTCTFVARW
jgi:hypothetical protein